MPTADTVHKMSKSDRRHSEQHRVNEARITERLRRGGLLTKDCTPMTSAEAGALFQPPAEPSGRITVRAICRALGLSTVTS